MKCETCGGNKGVCDCVNLEVYTQVFTCKDCGKTFRCDRKLGGKLDEAACEIAKNDNGLCYCNPCYSERNTDLTVQGLHLILCNIRSRE